MSISRDLTLVNIACCDFLQLSLLYCIVSNSLQENFILNLDEILKKCDDLSGNKNIKDNETEINMLEDLLSKVSAFWCNIPCDYSSEIANTSWHQIVSYYIMITITFLIKMFCNILYWYSSIFAKQDPDNVEVLFRCARAYKCKSDLVVNAHETKEACFEGM